MNTKRSRSRDWASLSDSVLDLIVEKLSSISDCLRFGAACKLWFSFVSSNYDYLRQRINSGSIQELPPLMIFTKRTYSTICTSLYNVTKGKKLSDLELPLPYTERCCGSSHGWLAFQRNVSLTFYLFNPFTRETICLPRLEDFVHKIILSKNPSDNPSNFEVLAAVMINFQPRGLALLKPGSDTWIFTYVRDEQICDMVYYDEGYYVVSGAGRVLSMDNTTLEPKVIAQPSIKNFYSHYEYYLVLKITTNELLRVEICHTKNDQNKSSSVEISKLVPNPTLQEYMFPETLDNIGDEALFLCNYGSVSILASKFSGCKSNSIYYMDHHSKHSQLQYSMDIIHIQDGSFHTDFSFNMSIVADYFAPPALWIIPTPKLTITS